MKIGVIIEHDDGVIWEYASTHDEIKTSFNINSVPGELYTDSKVRLAMPDYITGYEIKFDSDVDVAKMGTFIELRKRFASDKTADMIFELEGEITKLKSEKRRLKGKLDTLRKATENYGGNDPIYFDILDALNSEEIK